MAKDEYEDSMHGKICEFLERKWLTLCRDHLPQTTVPNRVHWHLFSRASGPSGVKS